MNFLRSSGLKSTEKVMGLRRADWRFLLPNPAGIFQHMVILGGPADLPGHMLDSGVVQRVSSSLSNLKDRADAIAVLYDARVNLAKAAASLTPEGCLYLEIDRRSIGTAATTPGRVIHQLRKVGLSPTGIYWAAPDFDHCKRYIPFQIPEPFRWYLSTLFLAGTLKHRVLEAIMRLFSRSSFLKFSSITPCFAVTAASEVSPEAVPSFLAHLKVPVSSKKALHPMLITSGQDDASRAVVLPFTPGEKLPLAVVKISTLPGFNINIKREQDTLKTVRQNLPNLQKHTVPEPLGLFTSGNLVFGIESVAAGHPLFVSTGRYPSSFQAQVEDLNLATDWLCSFHQSMGMADQLWNEARHQQWIDSPLNEYAAIFGLSPSEEHLFTTLRTRSRELFGRSLPAVPMHYDFIPGNIYRYHHSITVIDWEDGGNWRRDRLGPVLYDLLFYITFWTHLVNRAHDEESEMRVFQRMFLTPDRTDQYVCAALRAITGYMQTLRIHPDFMPVILVYLWIDQALHRYFRRQTLLNGEGTARSDNRCVRRVEMMASHADLLFAR